MERFDIAVIGAGASGLAAAVEAKRETPACSLALLERGERVGQKLLVTGNGRCNLTNAHITPARYNAGASRYAAVFADFPDDRMFFESLGLLLREDEAGRLYPYANQASAVLDALRGAALRSGAEERCLFEAADIAPRDGGFLVSAKDDRRIFAKRLVLAAGSSAGAAACDDAAGALMRKGSREIAPCVPGLAPLQTEPARTKRLKGLRIRAAATLRVGGKALRTEAGEVQFGEDYISGICVLDLSRTAARQTASQELSLDLAPELDGLTLLRFLQRARELREDKTAASLPAGLLPKAAANELMRQCADDAFRRNCGALTDMELSAAAAMLKDWRFPVRLSIDWRRAQISCGGVRDADGATLESSLLPGLYFCGELLDVDGDCGGYNLHWAWASGREAGRRAAQSLR